MGRKTYSDIEKKDAAAAYLVYGNSKMAGKQLSIPSRTIRTWTKADWWPDYMAEAKEVMQAELDGRLTRIANLATENVIDRLEHGDEVLDTRTGEARRKKVNARDCMVLGGIAIDKRQILRREPTVIKADNTDLKALAQEFAKLARQEDPQIVSYVERTNKQA